MGEPPKRSLVVVTSMIGNQLRLELRSFEDRMQGEAIASFDVPMEDSALFQSAALRVGMAIVVASLVGKEIPNALAHEMAEASRLAEESLRKRANENADAKFFLVQHLVAEARAKKSIALLLEADSALEDLLRRKHAPAMEWANVTWPRIREFTVRIIGQQSY
jgi:hypothetical protein